MQVYSGNCHPSSFMDSIWTLSSAPGPLLHDGMSSQRPRPCPQRTRSQSCKCPRGVHVSVGRSAGSCHAFSSPQGFQRSWVWKGFFSLIHRVSFNPFSITLVTLKIHSTSCQSAKSSLCLVKSQILSSAGICASVMLEVRMTRSRSLPKRIGSQKLMSYLNCTS